MCTHLRWAAIVLGGGQIASGSVQTALGGVQIMRGSVQTALGYSVHTGGARPQPVASQRAHAATAQCAHQLPLTEPALLRTFAAHASLCAVSKMRDSDACPRPTTDLLGVRRFEGLLDTRGVVGYEVDLREGAEG